MTIERIPADASDCHRQRPGAGRAHAAEPAARGVKTNVVEIPLTGANFSLNLPTKCRTLFFFVGTTGRSWDPADAPSNQLACVLPR
jgi:hypothetical protein